MQFDFQKSIPIFLRYEGGYSNHPRDPGGVTLEGVIQRVYDAFRDRKGKPRRPLTKAMLGTADWIAERNEIYRIQYWNAVRGDELPAGVDLFVADSSLNSGPYQAIKWLQRALRMNDVDGHLGEATLAALKAHPDHDALIADMAARRLGMLRSLTTWNDFGKGWSARVASVKAIAQAWAMGSVGPEPVEAHHFGSSAKAYASDVAQPRIDAATATKAGVSGASVSGLVQGAQDQLSPLIGTSDTIAKVYMALTVAGLLIAIGGFAYSLWASRAAKRAQQAIDGVTIAEVPEGLPA